MVELDQSIADREQVRANHDQAVHDQHERALEAEWAATDTDSFEAHASITQRHAELLRGQTRRDAHQAQLDDNQRGLEFRQRVLDDERDAIDTPPIPSAPPMETLLLGAAQARSDAAQMRAQAALARADEARRRAEAALSRAEAIELRVNRA